MGVVLGSNDDGLPRADPAALATAVLDEEARRHDAQSASVDELVIADDLLGLNAPSPAAM